MRKLVLLFCALLWSGLAMAGHDEAMSAYKNGNYKTAAKEFRKLAKQGNADAQFNLGVMYRTGQGLPQDYVQAVKWYRKAAEHGHAVAQYNLGVMYAKGRGVRQDDTQAANWYRKAAEHGLAAAQYNFGVMYAKGQGIPQDYVQAHMWLNLAAASGHQDAIEVRNVVASLMTAGQIKEAERLVRDWTAIHSQG